MAYRGVGSAATSAYYAFFTSQKPRNQQLRRFADVLLCLYCIFSAVSLVESAEDRAAFERLVPFSSVSLYVTVLLTCVAALACSISWFVYDVMQVFVAVAFLRTVFVDCNFDYWTRKNSVDFWNQFRMCADSFCVVLGMIMYLSCTKAPVYVKDEENKKDE